MRMSSRKCVARFTKEEGKLPLYLLTESQGVLLPGASHVHDEHAWWFMTWLNATGNSSFEIRAA